LFVENPIRLAGEKIVPGHIDEEGFGPLRVRKFSIGAWDGIDSSCIDDNVYAAKFGNGEVNRIG